MQKSNTITEAVRERYSNIAEKSGACCGPSCCDSTVSEMSLGYTEQGLASIPEGANLSLGCGNPTGMADIKVGETVIDLGSGAGIDCFLAAQKVGPSGHVIGIDMIIADPSQRLDCFVRGNPDACWFRTDRRLLAVGFIPDGNDFQTGILRLNACSKLRFGLVGEPIAYPYGKPRKLCHQLIHRSME